MLHGSLSDSRVQIGRLMEQYGSTSEMLGFFSRTSSEEAGAPVVCYTGVNSLSYVLGSYTVRIRDGKAAACWSWDGAASADGFDSPAWGAAQLAELCRTSRETHDLTAYFVQAEKLAALDGVAVGTGVLFGKDTADAIAEKQQTDAKAAESAAKLSAAEMESIAREALEQRYALTEAQSDHLRNEAENNRYLLFGSDNVPCCEFYFALGFEEDGYVGPGTGIYTVIVNAESGTVEDTLYDSALGGNGLKIHATKMGTPFGAPFLLPRQLRPLTLPAQPVPRYPDRLCS